MPRTLSVDFRSTKRKVDAGGKTEIEETWLHFDPEDIIAVVGGLIALIFAVAMIAGWVPTNRSTVGIIGFSGAGSAIAEIVAARNNAKQLKKGHRG